MIVAKTKMKRIPDTCKKCSLSVVQQYGFGNTDRVCCVNGYVCPLETKPSGNVGYTKPTWCPLMEI